MRTMTYSSRRSLARARLIRRCGIAGSVILFLAAMVEIIMVLLRANVLH